MWRNIFSILLFVTRVSIVNGLLKSCAAAFNAASFAIGSGKRFSANRAALHSYIGCVSILFSLRLSDGITISFVKT
jgi:hypothetical protein